MVSCLAATAFATESTRNGMSSLMIAMRMRLRPASPPVDSILRPRSPGRRVPATWVMNSAASRSASRERPWVSPGSACPVSAFRIDSTSGGSRRVWAVMGKISAPGTVAGGPIDLPSASEQPRLLASKALCLQGPADSAFDQRLILDDGHRLVIAVDPAAGYPDRAFLFPPDARQPKFPRAA